MRPTGKARGTSIEIPSYANLLRQCYGGQAVSEGYSPVAKSTEASSFEHIALFIRNYPPTGAIVI